MSNHKARLARIETAIQVRDTKPTRPAIELTHETRLARIHATLSSACRPDANPEEIHVAEGLAKLLLAGMRCAATKPAGASEEVSGQ
jgi:hypothetical protein